MNKISQCVLVVGFVFGVLPLMAQFKSVSQGTKMTSEQKQNSKILSSIDQRYHGALSTDNISEISSAKPWQALGLQGVTRTYQHNKFGGSKYIRSTQTIGERAVFSSLISRFSDHTSVSNLKDEASLKESWKDELGHIHHRFIQYRNGIRIYGSESILHIDANGGSFLQSELVPDDFELKAPSKGISTDHVKTLVMGQLDHYSIIEGRNTHLIDGDQWNIEEVYYFSDGELIHTYFVQVYPSIDDRQEYFVKVSDGTLLHKHTAICKFHNHDHSVDQQSVVVDGATVSSGTDLFGISRTINTYEVGSRNYLIDVTKEMFMPASSSLPDDPDGVIWTIDAFDTSPQNDNFNYDHVSVSNNTWNSKETEISAHYNAGLAYQYFNTKFNRNAIDNKGGNVISIVNVADENGNSMGNAFWNGLAMFYGNGDSAFLPLGRGLDVAGHELSHGVIQNSANLEYQGESGALNESFADIFGAMIDRDDWLIGEDVVRTSAFPSGALRSISDPHNGASTGDFNAGWQPRHYNERYTGSEDNGGVHINSGIPNYAFFRFASVVGKEMAENVYYRALTTYLSRSSQFADCRVAVVQAASDIGNSTVVEAANDAFDDVGIGASGGSTTTTQNEAETNLGEDFVLYGATDLSNLKLATGDGDVLSNPFVEIGVRSKPSVTDDGSQIIFVSTDNNIQLININWNTSEYNVEVFSDQSIWRNAIISKDGQRLAAVTDELEPIIYVYEFATGLTQAYTLYNPTFTEGVSTGDVFYADAMEFDITGQTILYDAFNGISGATDVISYWDVGVLEVYNRGTQSPASGNIQKLFSALPEDVSIGNPSFSKNSPYIIALDILEGNSIAIAGYNIETSDLQIITELADIGYPNYSIDDTKIIYDSPWLFGLDLASINLNSDKISGIDGTQRTFIDNAKWGVFFSNGARELYVNTDEIEIEQLQVMPNPASEKVTLSGDQLLEASHIEVIDQLGRTQYRTEIRSRDFHTLDVSGYTSGIYTIRVLQQHELLSTSRLVVR